MKVYHGLNDLPKIRNAIVTQGTFDGVHAAHQVIIALIRLMSTLGLMGFAM